MTKRFPFFRHLSQVSCFFKKRITKKKTVRIFNFQEIVQAVLINQNIYSMIPGQRIGSSYIKLIANIQRNHTARTITLWNHFSDQIILKFYSGPIIEEPKSKDFCIRKEVVIPLAEVSIRNLRNEMKDWFLNQQFIGFKIKFSFLGYRKVFYEYDIGAPTAADIAKDVIKRLTAEKTGKDLQKFAKYYSKDETLMEDIKCRVISFDSDSESRMSSSMFAIEIRNQMQSMLFPYCNTKKVNPELSRYLGDLKGIFNSMVLKIKSFRKPVLR